MVILEAEVFNQEADSEAEVEGEVVEEGSEMILIFSVKKPFNPNILPCFLCFVPFPLKTASNWGLIYFGTPQTFKIIVWPSPQNP